MCGASYPPTCIMVNWVRVNLVNGGVEVLLLVKGIKDGADDVLIENGWLNFLYLMVKCFYCWVVGDIYCSVVGWIF